jgi:hypothetical protein
MRLMLILVINSTLNSYLDKPVTEMSCEPVITKVSPL